MTAGLMSGEIAQRPSGQRVFGWVMFMLRTWVMGLLCAALLSGCFGSDQENNAMRVRACVNALGSIPGVGNAIQQGIPRHRAEVQMRCQNDESLRQYRAPEWICARPKIKSGWNYLEALDSCR